MLTWRMVGNSYLGITSGLLVTRPKKPAYCLFGLCLVLGQRGETP
jgi:hypothetical protein